MSLQNFLKNEILKFRLKQSLKMLLKSPERVELSVSKLIRKATENDVKTFLQVGSNDGKKNDPLFDAILQKKLKGIFVEPFEDNFRKLIDNYRDAEQELIFEQVGISDKPGNLDFYYITDISDDEPNWYDQVGSFDRETFIKNIEVVPSLLNRIGKKSIKCHTISEVLEKNGFDSIDLIHIDAEGFDYLLVRSIDFEKWNPKIILFEADWMTLYQLKELIRLLRSKHYQVFFSDIDCVAIKTGGY